MTESHTLLPPTRARARPDQAENAQVLRELLDDRDLTAERRTRGLTQTQLAELMGTTAQAVSRWEHGITVPCGHYAVKLRRWLQA